MIRSKQTGCLCCSSEKPYSIQRDEFDDFVEWYCGECGRRLARGFRADHRFANGPRTVPPTIDRELILNRENFHTVEAWWNSHAVAGAIHGRVVCGSEELYEFICHLQSTYG